MAAGNYKSGVAIIATYQAVGSATGKTVTMDVYDEAHAKDTPKCIAAMTEIGTTGRYYATFTPDAEGEWILIFKNTTDSNGEVVKAYAVAGHDVDSIGDAIDSGFTAGAKEASLAALATSSEIETLDTAMDSGFTAGAKEASLAALATSASITSLDSVIDAGFAAIGSPAMVG